MSGLDDLHQRLAKASEKSAAELRWERYLSDRNKEKHANEADAPEAEGNPTIELGLQHMLSGSAEQFPHAWTAPTAPEQTGGIITNPPLMNVTSGGPEALYLSKGAQIKPSPPPNWPHQWMHVDPPGPNRKIRWQAMDGTIHEQDAPAEQKYIIPGPKPGEMDDHRLRALVREEVHSALHPGTVDPRQYRHVDIRDSDGTRWRGMVYLVELEEDKNEH